MNPLEFDKWLIENKKIEYYKFLTNPPEEYKEYTPGYQFQHFYRIREIQQEFETESKKKHSPK